jgi:hypothetical protein
VVPGNHDRINFGGVADYQRLVCSREYPYMDTLAPGVFAVAVDTTAHGDDLDWRDMLSINSRGIVPFEATARVDELLSTLPKGSFVILCCHHHLLELPPDGQVDGLSQRVDPRLSARAENADSLLDVAEARGVGLILFGHRHRPTNDRFTIRSIPAACSGSVTHADAAGLLHYRVFDIEDGRLAGREWIDVSPKSVGLSEQLRFGWASRSHGAAESDTSTVALGDGDVAASMEEIKHLGEQADRRLLNRIVKRM